MMSRKTCSGFAGISRFDRIGRCRVFMALVGLTAVAVAVACAGAWSGIVPTRAMAAQAEPEAVGDQPKTPDETAPAEPAPEELARYRDAAEYSQKHGGVSLVIMKNGRIVFEQYADGRSADEPHRLASGTKSFWGVAVMAMVEDGLANLDEPVCDTITEWKTDPRKSKITPRHLLTLTSGLEKATNTLRGPGIADRFAYAVNLPAVHDPGSVFEYGPSHFFALGEFMKRKLAQSGRDGDPLDYLKKRVLDPIGLEIARWNRDAVGNPLMPFGAELTAREWAKFGELIRNYGEWNESPIIGGGFLEFCFDPGDRNRAYGLTFWLRPRATPGRGTQDPLAAVEEQGEPAESMDDSSSTDKTTPGEPRRSTRPRGPDRTKRIMPADVEIERPDGRLGGVVTEHVDAGTIIMAAGAGKQRLYIIRSDGLVIVRQGELVRRPGASARLFRDARFLSRILVSNAADTTEPAETDGGNSADGDTGTDGATPAPSSTYLPHRVRRAG